MQNKNRNLLIISLIALVNMLGYGIIIPILYAYSRKFGLSDFENGLLFAIYSVCQFVSTPIIGRLSDRFGRRPMLLLSITGTAVSFFTMAFAPNAFFLFLARAIDGLTAGNIPVAYAVISDSTRPQERAKAFGFIGSALNFGFVFGPAVSALTVGFGAGVPFVIAGVITVIAIILTALFLPETNRHMGEVEKGKIIDIPRLWHFLFDEHVGITFLLTLVYFLAFSCAMIYGFQPYTLKVLHISVSENAVLFTLFGAVGLFMQTFLVGRIAKAYGMKRPMNISFLFIALAFFIVFAFHSFWAFIITILLIALFNSIIQTLIPTILSDEADAKSQGSIMGLNTSYQSIGMIVGPFLGGLAATVTISMPFLVGSLLILVGFYLSLKIFKTSGKPESAF